MPPKKKARVRKPVSPVELMQTCLERDLDTAFLHDETGELDLPRAGNIIEWIMDPRFYGVRPFARQMQAAVTFLEQYCPFCSDMEYLKRVSVDDTSDDFLERIQLLRFGICPECSRTEHDMDFEFYYEFSGCWGMRSGKTAVTAGMLAPYHLHRLLMLREHPSSYYSLLPGQGLTGIFVAVTAGQARETLWDAFTAAVAASKWYREYFRVLRAYEKRTGQIVHKNLDTFIAFIHKGLGISYMGADTRTIRGRTRFFSAIDEIGWFDHQDSARIRANAAETHKACVRSLRTVRAAASRLRDDGMINVPDGLSVNISSPAERQDMILSLVRSAKPGTRKLGSHLATWECNPTITRADLQEEFDKDEQEAERDYGAIPPLAANRFISNDEAIIGASHSDVHMMCSLVSEVKTVGTSSFMTGRLRHREENRYAQAPCVLAVDNGEAHNSLAVAMICLDGDNFVAPLLGELVPDPHRVSLPSVEEDVIIPLVEKYNVRYVVYDRWESLRTTQYLDQHYQDVECYRYSMQYDDFTTVRSLLLDGGTLVPRCEVPIDTLFQGDMDANTLAGKPVASFLLQAATVRLVGHKIAKPAHGNDDIWRAWALGVRTAHTHRDVLAAPYARGGMQGTKAVIYKGSAGAMSRSTGKVLVGDVARNSKGQVLITVGSMSRGRR